MYIYICLYGIEAYEDPALWFEGPEATRIPEAMGSRILTFMWSFAPLLELQESRMLGDYGLVDYGLVVLGTLTNYLVERGESWTSSKNPELPKALN